MKTIGYVIDPTRDYDLEASLRLQRDLASRARETRWRFKGHWVTTGPYETMMGHPSCGSGSSKYSTVELRFPCRLGLEEIVHRINHWILRAAIDYPGFAELSEPQKELPFGYCGEALARLAGLEGRRTKPRLNSCHARARVVRDVALVCCWDGIFVDAAVSFNRRPGESNWSIFWLLGEPLPRWNERGRLASWLERVGDKLERIIEDKHDNEKTGHRGRGADQEG